ncbi:MAG TPA: ATP-dependent DNA ligase, partial [Acidimicrobiia bacterium]|nr:ATP-dependent DNA ligase [Acidimicrobiia bacterium]
WDELDTIDPEAMTLASLPGRLSERGDPWGDTYGTPQSLEPLLALHERDMAAGLADAPWPPVYPKMPNEPPRVAPSRAKKPT